MKQVLVAFVLALTMGSAALADAPKETTKVCVDVKDKEGKVVGINNFKIGGAEALGFALESDAIKESVNKIADRELI